jgi:hypothetical protein
MSGHEDMASALLETVKAERALSRTLKNYPGEWVAIRGQDVVAHAKEFDELMAQIDSDEVDSVLRVAEDQRAVCFF